MKTLSRKNGWKILVKNASVSLECDCLDPIYASCDTDCGCKFENFEELPEKRFCSRWEACSVDGKSTGLLKEFRNKEELYYMACSMNQPCFLPENPDKIETSAVFNYWGPCRSKSSLALK